MSTIKPENTQAPVPAAPASDARPRPSAGYTPTPTAAPTGSPSVSYGTRKGPFIRPPEAPIEEPRPGMERVHLKTSPISAEQRKGIWKKLGMPDA